MAGKYQRYPEYKDSGEVWLGIVPKHWDVLPARSSVVNVVSKNARGKEFNYLSLVTGKGVIPYAEKGAVGNKKPDDLSKCKIVRKGDLVLNSMNYAIGSYGLSAHDGICSPVYIILRAVDENLLTRFAYYLFGNAPFQKHLATFGNGILAHRAAVSWDDIKSQNLPSPPLSEQQAVANFLDHEIAKIDVLIEKQEKLTVLLKEKRQAVISNTVTKGLNPDVPMKNSGIECFGKVPKHWFCISLNKILLGIEQGSSPNAVEDSPLSVAKVSSIRKGRFVGEERKPVSKSDYMSRYTIKDNDFLMTRGNTPDLVADCCIVENLSENKIMMSDLIYRLQFDTRRACQRYIMYFLMSFLGRYQITRDARGTSMTMAKVSQEQIKKWLVALPNTKEEQQDISKYLDSFSKKIDGTVERTERMIKLLREKKAALISSAVTGKIDTRNI